MKYAYQMIINLFSRKKRNKKELNVPIKWFCEILYIPGMSQISSFKKTTTYKIVIGSAVASNRDIHSFLKPVTPFKKVNWKMQSTFRRAIAFPRVYIIYHVRASLQNMLAEIRY